MSGWVKLHRSLGSSAVADKPDYLSVWIHLLMSASHKPREIVVGRQIVKLETGQLVFGRKAFSAKIGVSEAVIRSALDVLKGLEQITIKSTTKYSIISITKWHEYQSEEPANRQQSTSNQPATNHKQEGKEFKEGELFADESAGDAPQRAVKVDPVPYDLIIEAYRRCLPDLPQPESMTPKRKAGARSIWRQYKKSHSPDFWDRYFTYVGKQEFLCNMKGIGINWLLNFENMCKVIEGNYE